MGLAIGVGLGLPFDGGVADATPGGAANALLLEDGVFGFLLEDGSGDILMEA